jgi:hypothetical protein
MEITMGWDASKIMVDKGTSTTIFLVKFIGKTCMKPI